MKDTHYSVEVNLPKTRFRIYWIKTKIVNCDINNSRKGSAVICAFAPAPDTFFEFCFCTRLKIDIFSNMITVQNSGDAANLLI
nr:hypothetical protein [Citrobacter freundii]